MPASMPGKSLLGICLGMQVAVIEFARSVAGEGLPLELESSPTGSLI